MCSNGLHWHISTLANLDTCPKFCSTPLSNPVVPLVKRHDDDEINHSSTNQTCSAFSWCNVIVLSSMQNIVWSCWHACSHYFFIFQTGLNLTDWAMRVPFDFIKNVGEAKAFHMCPQGQSKGHWATEFCWCLNVNGFFNAASDLLLFGGDFGFCLLLQGVFFFFKVKTEDYQDYVTEWKKKRLRRFWLSSVTRRRPHPIAFPVPVPSADTRKSCLHLGAALRLYFLSFIVSASSLFLCLKIKNVLLGVSTDLKKKKKTPLEFNQC